MPAPETQHEYLTLNHKPEGFTFTNATTRAAGSGLTLPSGTPYTIVVADVGRWAYQTDTGEFWRLDSIGPLVWSQATGAAGGPAGGDLTGTYPNPTLVAVVTGATLGNATHTMNLTFDNKGRITAASLNAIVLPESAITGLVADLAATEKTTNKGTASGYAGLDGSGRVPFAQLPSGLAGAFQYQGVWNAATNISPTLVSSVGTQGFVYKVSVAGNTVLDGNTLWQVGDLAIFDGTVWDKVDNYELVTSVASRIGNVVLTYTDVSGAVNLAGDLGGTNAVPTVPEVRNARVSSLFGTYATLEDRLEAIESALVVAGTGPTIGIAGRAYIFTNPLNSMYIGTL